MYTKTAYRVPWAAIQFVYISATEIENDEEIDHFPLWTGM